ncbi:hypothetical protein GYMLUDRAFT_230967 [Collybiopsis luxurians FD-317 M1]|uniref:Methyltransferase domain-containing protein n=1 Tax=Collybiopsis luxurians FD-317 M1 TaxID=944289 RepID=A0A0D0CC04_9AGAR|nr:hypothetical protein GYMLUDRAFT_230967 [Collybiopsis luxurians FD-317 M1]
MNGHSQHRYYISDQYVLPADAEETARLNVQHRRIVKCFGDRLSLAPLDLKSGDRVLESAAGTGIWALEFFKEHKTKGIILDVEGFDITNRQFPRNHPPNIHFSLHSVADLPAEWNGTFLYAHQRLMVSALSDSLWRKAASELFRVLVPGGWLELVEIEVKSFRNLDVGPYSKKLQSLIVVLYAKKGLIVDSETYHPLLLKEAGFVDIRFEPRRLLIKRSGENGYHLDGWDLEIFCRALKEPILNGGGYSFVETEGEFEELLRGAMFELGKSNEASVTIHTILARKP